MIYCVWYPSGGFGHFVNAVLTLYGKNFVRPSKSLEFSPTGDSHSLDLVVPKYQYNVWPGGVDFVADKNYCVLVDNGINDESETFKSSFADSTVIKICYSDHSWPVIARTLIEKAMASCIEEQLPASNWETSEPWAQREKYFLFLKDHQFRHAWRPANNNTILVDDMFDYDCFFNKLNTFVPVDSFRDHWLKWRLANDSYIKPIEIAKRVIDQVIFKKSQDLDSIDDLWTQAVVYYYIWIAFGIEVPHNDFSKFFSNTSQIMELVA